uniref:Uncharacterized protein n=1 Tax=Acrobeloides nanus TaxID=290746 RepID=A0A914CJJ0_9BILA
MQYSSEEENILNSESASDPNEQPSSESEGEDNSDIEGDLWTMFHPFAITIIMFYVITVLKTKTLIRAS